MRTAQLAPIALNISFIYSPQYFIYLKNGRLRPVDVPPGTLAVKYRGQYRVVFSRMETDEEYFRNHPEMPFRLKLHRSRHHAPDYFEFTISTADPEIYATGDKWDAFSDLRFYPGTPRERVIRACLHMLCDPNRLSRKGCCRLMANPEWRRCHEMTDDELWRLAMGVIEPEVSALQ